MAYLIPDAVRMVGELEVCEKIIPDSARASKWVAPWVVKGGLMKPCRPITSPIGVTIHNTSDLVGVEEDSEQYVRATWPNCNMGGVVVHYYVDEVNAWQTLHEWEQGWHAADGFGPGNTQTIAVECIMDGSGSSADLKARDNAALLIADIMYRLGWNPRENLFSHNKWMGLPDYIVADAPKNCPYFILPDYAEFVELIEYYMGCLSADSGDESEEEGSEDAGTEEPEDTERPGGVNDFVPGDKVRFLQNDSVMVYGGSDAGEPIPDFVREAGWYQVLALSSRNPGKGGEVLLAGIFSWVPASYLEIASLSGGDKVRVREGALYAGNSDHAGKLPPLWVYEAVFEIDNTKDLLGQRLLKGINSWFRDEDLIYIS